MGHGLVMLMKADVVFCFRGTRFLLWCCSSKSDLRIRVQMGSLCKSSVIEPNINFLTKMIFSYPVNTLGLGGEAVDPE